MRPHRHIPLFFIHKKRSGYPLRFLCFTWNMFMIRIQLAHLERLWSALNWLPVNHGHLTIADPFEIEHIDDVRVEISQAEHMADLAVAVIASVVDAYGNLSSRDLDWTMKLLTVYSIVLTVPTIVSGFYGEKAVQC